uniref:Uncharacterized protein n=1 Tax=Knipowitschia caucasica TaxID=637954 RepID=A0AAV2M2H0_KNICA
MQHAAANCTSAATPDNTSACNNTSAATRLPATARLLHSKIAAKHACLQYTVCCQKPGLLQQHVCCNNHIWLHQHATALQQHVCNKHNTSVTHVCNHSTAATQPAAATNAPAATPACINQNACCRTRLPANNTTVCNHTLLQQHVCNNTSVTPRLLRPTRLLQQHAGCNKRLLPHNTSAAKQTRLACNNTTTQTRLSQLLSKPHVCCDNPLLNNTPGCDKTPAATTVVLPTTTPAAHTSANITSCAKQTRLQQTFCCDKYVCSNNTLACNTTVLPQPFCCNTTSAANNHDCMHNTFCLASNTGLLRHHPPLQPRGCRNNINVCLSLKPTAQTTHLLQQPAAATTRLHNNMSATHTSVTNTCLLPTKRLLQHTCLLLQHAACNNTPALQTTPPARGHTVCFHNTPAATTRLQTTRL